MYYFVANLMKIDDKAEDELSITAEIDQRVFWSSQ